MLNKKVVFFSLISVFIIISMGFSSAVAENNLEEPNKTVFETKYYNGLKVEKKLVELSEKEAEQVKQILYNLDDAISKNDETKVSEYTTILKEKGIFTEKDLRFLSLLNKNQQSLNSKGDQIFEKNCIFSAIGNGFMLFPVEQRVIERIRDAVINAVDDIENPIAAFFAALGIFVVLIVLLYLPVMLITHLVPFRIGMSNAQVQLNSGSMKIGQQSVAAPVKVNLTSFTGVTISTPYFSNNDEGSGQEEKDDSLGFLFVWGYAGKAEVVES